MRLFWSFMVVLFAASMAVLAMPERAESSIAESTTAVSRPAPAETARAGEPAASVVGDTSGDEQDIAEPDAVIATEQGTPLEAPATGANQATIAVEEDIATDEVAVESDVSAIEQDPAPSGDPFAAAARAFLGEDEPTPAEVASIEQAVAQLDEPVQAQAVTDNAEQSAPARDEAAPSRLAVNEDGSLLIDGRITIPGAGTAERPYVLDWPVLTGVGREYKPEKGMDELPEWLTALEGKRVRLTGHIVLPLVAKATDELLLTMNPWDGCCVGVPPTPYDALEVSLSEAVSMSGASMYGAMEGTFRVDPYIVDGWLLGLYLLEDAEVKG